MFFEALQSYYAPLASLIIFVIMVCCDRIHGKKIKRLFLIESAVIVTIIVATWSDRCLSAMDLGGLAWKLRTVTTFINFAVSPLSPAILVEIYRKDRQRNRSWLLYVPEIINAVFCVVSFSTGWIFHISAENEYTRGALVALPFAVSAFYMLILLFYSAKENNTPNRHAETLLLLAIMGAIAVAMLLEVIFVKRFMIWSTTEICVILYYMELNIQKNVYDGLTGTFSRNVYIKQLERINNKKSCVIAMIDLNGLKTINDSYGHKAGDSALCGVATSILRAKPRSMRLYRFGGDEFALFGKNSTCEELEAVLKSAQLNCPKIQEISVSFAYGIAEYRPELDLSAVTATADERMYANKAKMKFKAEG